MDEPSVLDFIKAKLTPWRNQEAAHFSEAPVQTEVVEASQPLPELVEQAPAPHPESPRAKPSERYRLPVPVFLAIISAVAAQSLLEPPQRSVIPALVLYALALVNVVWAAFSFRQLTRPVAPEGSGAFSMDVRPIPFILSILLMVIGFILLGSNFITEKSHFTWLNVTIWLLLIVFTLWAWWQPGGNKPASRFRISHWLSRETWAFQFSKWNLVVLAALVVAVFFRFYRLSQVPGEMFSDQAEKLWDVMDLLGGQTKIFFERNTGREFFQFYLTAAIIKLFGTGISFLSLKLGTAFAGVFALPFIYKLGKEISGRWVGLLALLLAGISYWPNVISRIGLRFPFYPMFAAPALYFMVRGLRQRNRNDLVLAGLFTGLGLHGYSPFRFLPFVLIAGVLIYMLHQQSKDQRQGAFWSLVVLAMVAFMVFLPLFSYMVTENTALVTSRALSRLTSSERALPGAPVAIFFDNLWRALIMPFWNNGNVWVHSVTERPALDVICAAFFVIGMIIVILRYARYKNWVDLFLLVSIPLLMMPSVLSLAFPEENPSLNRTGAAYIPIFIIVAIGLESMLRVIKDSMGPRWGRLTAVMLGFFLIWSSGLQSFDLVFRQFDQQFNASAWNSSEIGAVIKGFAGSVGTPETAYVVPYPYWVDTRLVGINAGFPDRDYAIWPKDFEATRPDPRTKMFILKPEDTGSLDQLRGLYPQGILSQRSSLWEGKDFLVFLVPGIPASSP